MVLENNRKESPDALQVKQVASQGAVAFEVEKVMSSDEVEDEIAFSLNEIDSALNAVGNEISAIVSDESVTSDDDNVSLAFQVSDEKILGGKLEEKEDELSEEEREQLRAFEEIGAVTPDLNVNDTLDQIVQDKPIEASSPIPPSMSAQDLLPTQEEEDEFVNDMLKGLESAGKKESAVVVDDVVLKDSIVSKDNNVPKDNAVSNSNTTPAPVVVTPASSLPSNTVADLSVKVEKSASELDAFNKAIDELESDPFLSGVVSPQIDELDSRSEPVGKTTSHFLNNDESINNFEIPARIQKGGGASVGREMPVSTLLHLMGLPTASHIQIIEKKIDNLANKVMAMSLKLDRILAQTTAAYNESHFDRIDFQLTEVRTIMKKLFPRLIASLDVDDLSYMSAETDTEDEEPSNKRHISLSSSPLKK